MPETSLFLMITYGVTCAVMLILICRTEGITTMINSLSIMINMINEKGNEMQRHCVMDCRQLSQHVVIIINPTQTSNEDVRVVFVRLGKHIIGFHGDTQFATSWMVYFVDSSYNNHKWKSRVLVPFDNLA